MKFRKNSTHWTPHRNNTFTDPDIKNAKGIELICLAHRRHVVGPPETSNMENFSAIVNGFYSLTTVTLSSLS